MLIRTLNPPTPADRKGERVREERLWTTRNTTTGRGPAAAAKASAAAGGKGSPKFIAAARGKSNQNHHFLCVFVRHLWGAILGFLRPSLPWCFPIQQQPAAGRSRQQQAAAGAAKFQFYSRVSEVTLGPFLGFHCYVFALSDVFRKGCLAVCFLLWRLFDCSSTTAAPQQHHSSSRSSHQ